MRNYEKESIIGKIEQLVFCMILFIYGFNLANTYLYISCIVIAICFAYVAIRHRIYKSWQTLFVFCFLLSYFFLTYYINGEIKIEFVVECLTFYTFGAISYVLAEDKHTAIFRLALSGASGFGIYGIITSLYSILDSGRYMQDIWGGGRLAATQVAGWGIMFVAIVPWIIFKGKEIKVGYRFALYILTILSVVSFFILSSRTGLIVSVLIVLLIFLLAVRNKQKKVVVCILGTIALGLSVFAFDVGGIQSTFWNSNLILRIIQKQNTLGSAFDTGRTDRWIYVLYNFGDYMNGSYYYSKQLGGMIHNFFLDLYDECGIIALCVVTPVFVRLVFGLVRLQKRKMAIADKVGLLAWFIIIAILFMTEPVHYYGRTNLMAFFFFMTGIVEFAGALEYREERLCEDN